MQYGRIQLDRIKLQAKEVKENKDGILYLVSTPIGNDDDITLRALNILNSCDLVVCEEIKVGAKILHSYKISKPLEELNEQNEDIMAFTVIDMVKSGKKIALISDCGTPVFEDPGAFLVKQALQRELDVRVIPGVTSIMTALVRSGFDIKRFLYTGFLSRKPEERLKELGILSRERRTVCLLETPYRLMPVLEAAAEVMPDRQAYLGANLTMHYETHHYGTFKELFEKFQDKKFKGEFVICFEQNRIDRGGRFSNRGRKDYDRKAPGRDRYDSPKKRFGGKPGKPYNKDRRFRNDDRRNDDNEGGWEKRFKRKDNDRRDSGKRDFGRGDSGRRDYNKKDFSRNDSGRRDFDKREFGRKDFDRKDSGKKDSGKRDFGPRNFGRKPRGGGEDS